MTTTTVNMDEALSIYEKLSQERKELQSKGLMPSWFITGGWQLFKEKYLYNATTPYEQYKRIANHLAQYAPKEYPEWWNILEHGANWAEAFFNIMWNGWLSPSTPVLSNTGTDRGCSVSCSNTYFPDSINGIYTRRAEIANLTKEGFGTSAYLGDIRPRGAKIKTGGTSSGVLPVFKGIIEDMQYVVQASRRGSCAAYIEIDHGDFYELADYIENFPDDANIGWIIKDSFIERLNNNDKEAHKRFKRSLKLKMITGKGYFFFVDRANRLAPEMYKKLNLDIKSSNLCVTGDTLIHTDNGMERVIDLYQNQRKFKALVDKRTELDGAIFDYDSDVYSTESIPSKDRTKSVNIKEVNLRDTNGMHLTAKNAEVFEVVVDGGYSIKCTSNHKFYVIDSRDIITKKSLKDIDITNDRLLIQSNEGHFGTNGTYELGYVLGSMYGDGGVYNNVLRLKYWDISDEFKSKIANITMALKSQYGLEFRNVKEYEYRNNTIVEYNMKSDSSRKFIELTGFESKSKFPEFLYTASKDTISGFINGMMDADGCSFKSYYGDKKIGKFTFGLQIVSINEELLKGMQRLLINLGVYSRVFKHKKEKGIFVDPHTGVEYVNNETYRLDIAGKDTIRLKDKIGRVFTDPVKEAKLNKTIEDRNIVFDNVPLKDSSMTVKIKSITSIGHEDVYDTTQLTSHSLIFNGIVTGNCNEIMLFSDKDHSYTCVLSSINVSKYDELKDKKVIFISTVFLDCVAEDFIQKGKTKEGLERAVRFTEKGRALGLGVTGFATYLQTQNMSFEGLEAHMFNIKLFKHMDEESKEASQWLAKVLGEPEWCAGTSLRNTHRIAIAPTKSTALIMGGISEGISPDVAYTYEQLTPVGEINRMNPNILQLMKDRGVYDEAHITEVVNAQGSLQGVDWLSDEEKLVYRTAFEINQEAILRLASARQKFIDQGQSLNLFFAANEDEEYIAEIHQKAFTDPYIKGLYYCYSKAGVTAAKDECVACQ